MAETGRTRLKGTRDLASQASCAAGRFITGTGTDGGLDGSIGYICNRSYMRVRPSMSGEHGRAAVGAGGAGLTEGSSATVASPGPVDDRTSYTEQRGPGDAAVGGPFPGSILFPRATGGAEPDRGGTPPFFRDLNLDQLVDSLIHGREEYDLAPFFCHPLQDLDSISYRQEVMRDLEAGSLRGHVESFAGSMREMRRRLANAGKVHNEYQKMSWFLEAVDAYCGAVGALRSDLSQDGPSSRALRGLLDFLRGYESSEGYAALQTGARQLKRELSEITYRVHIQDLRVSVSKHEGEPDYSADVRETFERFREGEVVGQVAWDGSRHLLLDMNTVEEQVVGLVAQLYPDLFERLAGYCKEQASFLDSTVRRFDREVQFYLAYLKLLEPLRSAGLQFCYPSISGSKAIRASETFDLLLATRLVREQSAVVSNDFYLEGEERIVVVSGPNQGGKTTFARTFGQLHYLARLGCAVPGRDVRLFLSDNIFTHFEREEHIESLRGKLEDELVRMREVLQQATRDSVVIVNEGFSSTTVEDAEYLGREVLERLTDLGCLCVYVTFIDELSRLSRATVSMVSMVVPENPTRRTFKLERRPADGRAYAMVIAQNYGLTRQMVRERLSR